ncbi:MAG: ATP-binding protein [Clostridium sp.]|uniref:ATP-binding protein n=1 Tax=Clostridium sp. TaxID=1506 RepID=UPI002FCAB335
MVAKDKEYVEDYSCSQYEEYNNGIFKFNEHVLAKYIKQDEPTFQGNELIEALPPVKNIDQSFRSLYRPPLYLESEKNESKEYRIQATLRLLDYLIPMIKNFEVESNIANVIRQGYVSKRITSPEYINELKKYSSLLTSHYSKESSEAACICSSSASSSTGFSILGISGGGKTTAVSNSLVYYPQVIQHTGYEGNRFLFTQVTWLKIDCTYNGSLKGLCQKFFMELDKILNTDYLRKYGKNSIGIDRMILSMAQLSLKHGLGLLVIDEIQHLSSSVKGENILNYFVTMMNEIRVPIVYIGTYKAHKSILSKDFRHARRAMGIENINWGVMLQNEEWNMFVEDLWRYQWVKNTSILTKEIKKLIYEKTVGITDRIIKLFVACQIEAIVSGKEEITETIIKKVADNKFNLTKRMTNALLTDDIDILSEFEDLCSPDITGEALKSQKRLQIEERVNEIYNSQMRKIANKESEVRSNLIITLSRFGHGIDKVKKSIDIVIEKHGYKKEESFLLNEVVKLLIKSDEIGIKSMEEKAKGKKNKQISNEERSKFILENSDDMIKSIIGGE